MTDSNDRGLEVVLFAHTQGNFLGGCLSSIRRAATYAETRGLDLAFTVILYAATPLTIRMVERNLDERWRVLDFPQANLHDARNAARLALRKPYAAFVDGYDLWCQTWLYAAWKAVLTRAAVWRPELLLTFGNDFHLNAGYSAVFQPLNLFDPALLISSNPVPSGFVAPKRILESQAWPSVDPKRGWGAVDRWWSCEIAARGHAHRAVPCTFHYRRVPEAVLNTSQIVPSASEDRIGPSRLAKLQSASVIFTARVGSLAGR